MDDEPKSVREPEDEDPVEFLLEKKEYHDWTVIVKDSSTGTQEEFGVISHNLVAHSKVFRTMMSDPKWVKDKEVVISDMSPESFNLIYRFVNGGDLGLQEISRESLAKLALAADMYMMPRLVKEACKHLVPTTVDHLFPALEVISLISNTGLDTHVEKFVQLNTRGIIKSPKFLELEEQNVEFFVKQEKLSCTELEVWKFLVKWAKHQVGDDGKKTLRSVLGSSLQHVRFRTLTHEDIVKEVVPTDVLTTEEFSSLLCAVIGRQPWSQPGLCNSEIARQTGTLASDPDKVYVFKSEQKYHYIGKPETLEKKSFFILYIRNNIELQSFVFKPKPHSELKGLEFYSMNCVITVRKLENKTHSFICSMTTTREIFGADEEFTVLTLTSDNQFLKLEARNKYHFSVALTPEHMTFRSMYFETDCTERRRYTKGGFVQMTGPYHVQEMRYKILP